MPRNAVGPTAESLRYGDAVFRKTSNVLQPRQFKAFMPRVVSPTEDNGWLGPLGVTTMHSTAGSMYGYGVPSGRPQY